VKSSAASVYSRTIYASGSGANVPMYNKHTSSSPVSHRKTEVIALTGGMLAGANVRGSSNRTIEVICSDFVATNFGRYSSKFGSKAYVDNWEMTATFVSFNLNPAGAAVIGRRATSTAGGSPGSATGANRGRLRNRFVRSK